jgi:multiple sugar transport system permease protein
MSPVLIVSTIGVTILAILYVLPLYWMLTGSLEAVTDTLRVPPNLFPKDPNLENFVNLFTSTAAPRWFLNSVGVSAAACVGAVLLCSLAGYSLGTKTFRGSNVLFWIIVVAMLLPSATTLVPLYLLMRDLHWIDTYMGVIAPELARPFGVFLVRQFAHTIPRELFDAARVDGASELRIFRSIGLPLLRPAVAAVAIFAFIGTWENYIWQLVIINSDKLLTLPVGVAKAATASNAVNLGLVMAGATVSFLPIFLIFVLFQGYFAKGITAGAVRG